MSNVLIAFGGNLGDVAETLQNGLERLRQLPHVELIKSSSLYETAAIGFSTGERYLNSAATIRTELDPVVLLDQLQSLERQLGRQRTMHWGPRTLDLDIILWDERTISTDRLIVPHPAAFYRRFVLDPAVEIAADWIHPQFGLSLKSLRDKLLQRPLRLSACGDDELQSRLIESQRDRFEIITTSSDEAVIVFDTLGEVSGPQVISLQQVADKFAMAQQVLLAATDEPQLLRRTIGI